MKLQLKIQQLLKSAHYVQMGAGVIDCGLKTDDEVKILFAQPMTNEIMKSGYTQDFEVIFEPKDIIKIEYLLDQLKRKEANKLMSKLPKLSEAII